jgi:hypothetical protein
MGAPRLVLKIALYLLYTFKSLFFYFHLFLDCRQGIISIHFPVPPSVSGHVSVPVDPPVSTPIPIALIFDILFFLQTRI